MNNPLDIHRLSTSPPANVVDEALSWGWKVKILDIIQPSGIVPLKNPSDSPKFTFYYSCSRSHRPSLIPFTAQRSPSPSRMLLETPCYAFIPLSSCVIADGYHQSIAQSISPGHERPSLAFHRYGPCPWSSCASCAIASPAAARYHPNCRYHHHCPLQVHASHSGLH